MEPLSFYRSQSAISNPGAFAYLFDALPDNIDDLCKAVQGSYIHYTVAQQPDSGVPASHIGDVDTRHMEAILARIVALSDRPLTEPRPREQRFVGCCRDAALLLCSMLRHKGIPARIRVGFAAYINIGAPGFYCDHVITEYCNAAENPWKLVDAEQNDGLIAHNHIDFDVHDIPRDKFLVAGAAWRLIQAGAARSENFGVSPQHDFRGVWAIRDRIIHDLAALNKVELLLWDWWSPIKAHETNLAADESALIEQVANATGANPPDFETISSLYQDIRLKASTPLMTYSPVAPPRQVDLNL
jgi:hypothetical protein